MTQRAPASPSTSRPSRKGKKASLATAEPCNDNPALDALMPAMRALSTRLICPAPTPSVMPLAQKTMALLLTNLATFQAKSKSAHCAVVGATVVTTRSSLCATFLASLDCTNRPPPTRLKSSLFMLCTAPSASGTSSTRRFCLAASRARASAFTLGAMMTSTNCLLLPMRSALARSRGRLKATMPPKADVGSVWKALA